MAKHKRRRSSAASRRGSSEPLEHEDGAPGKPEILELLGKYLELEDVLMCRQVCKLWRSTIANGVGAAEAVLQVNEELACTPEKIRKALPHLQSLKLHLSARATKENYGAFCRAANGLKLLKELQLVCYVPEMQAAHQMQPFDLNLVNVLAGCSCLRHQLRSLTITGRWATFSYNVVDLSGLPQLTKLVLQPQVSPLGLQSPSQQWVSLNATNPGFRGEHLCMLTMLTRLQHLDLWMMPPAEKQVYRLSALTKLTHLALRNTYLDPKALEVVPQLPHLRCLRVGLLPGSPDVPVPLDCRGLVHAAQLTSLQLHLRERNLGDRSFRAITRLHALDALHLDLCSGWDDGPDVIRLLTRLTCLELRNTILTSAPWEAIRQLKSLKQLHLVDFHEPGPQVTVSQRQAPLERINEVRRQNNLPPVEPVPPPTPRSPGYLWRDLQGLQELVVSGRQHKDLTDKGSVAYSLWCAPELRHLHVDFPVAKEHALDVASLSQHLTSLHLSNVWTVWRQSKGPGGLQTRLGALRQLSLDSACLVVLPKVLAPPALSTPRESWQLRNAIVQALEKKSPELKEVRRSNQVRQLLEMLPQELQLLRLLGLPQLQNEDLQAVTRFTRLHELAVHSIGNQRVSHAALKSVAALSQLQVLVWEVGDMFELIPHPPTLARLKQLQVLGITWSVYHQMSRWSALALLDLLPHCQLCVR